MSTELWGPGWPVHRTSVQEFFAGTAAGVNLDTPQSLDHFITLTPTNYESEESNTILSQTAANTDLIITTGGSATFTPNYYNFIKVGNAEEDLITVQQGSNPSYTPSNDLERRAGTHRYIIYASQTGSNGETHQVFHTVTLDAFANEAPEIIPGTGEQFTLSIAHDNNTGNVIVHSTESTDANIKAEQEDFFTKYKVAKYQAGGNTSTTSNPTYGMDAISHLVDFLPIISNDQI